MNVGQLRNLLKDLNCDEMEILGTAVEDELKGKPRIEVQSCFDFQKLNGKTGYLQVGIGTSEEKRKRAKHYLVIQ